jgi:hypothetical protein
MYNTDGGQIIIHRFQFNFMSELYFFQQYLKIGDPDLGRFATGVSAFYFFGLPEFGIAAWSMHLSDQVEEVADNQGLHQGVIVKDREKYERRCEVSVARGGRLKTECMMMMMYKR